MRIQKEIENVERVKDKIATMPLTMEDAIEFHKQVVDRIEKERKEINKELDLDDDIEEKGFTGASKEPKKVSTPELKKMKLSESLFHSLNEANEDKFHVVIEYKDGNVYEDTINRDFWFGVLQPSIEKDSNVINYKAEKASLNEGYYGYHNDDVDEILNDIENILHDNGLDDFYPFVNSPSGDWISIDCGSDSSVRPKMKKVLKAAGYNADYDEYDDYIEIDLTDLNESLNEGYRTVNEIYRDIENFLSDSDLDGKVLDLQIESEDWIDIDCRDEDRKHVIDVLQSAGYDVDYDEDDDYVKIYVGDLYESLNECNKFKKGDCKNYALDEAKISRQNQRRKREANLQRKEAERKRAEEERKKAEEEARKKERIGDAAWGEKDWIAEREKGDLDFSNYSDEEKAEIEKRLKAFDDNPTAKAQYQRKKEAEERRKAEEERKKAEQKKEEKIKQGIDTFGKVAKAPGELLKAAKKGLNIK